MKLRATKDMCAITRKAIRDYNFLSEQAFLNKYSCRKSTYRKRVIKYGDPYMKAPLAKIAKFLKKHFS